MRGFQALLRKKSTPGLEPDEINKTNGHSQALINRRTLEPEREPPARVKPNIKRWEETK